MSFEHALAFGVGFYAGWATGVAVGVLLALALRALAAERTRRPRSKEE